MLTLCDPTRLVNSQPKLGTVDSCSKSWKVSRLLGWDGSWRRQRSGVWGHHVQPYVQRGGKLEGGGNLPWLRGVEGRRYERLHPWRDGKVTSLVGVTVHFPLSDPCGAWLHFTGNPKDLPVVSFFLWLSPYLGGCVCSHACLNYNITI